MSSEIPGTFPRIVCSLMCCFTNVFFFDQSDVSSNQCDTSNKGDVCNLSHSEIGCDNFRYSNRAPANGHMQKELNVPVPAPKAVMTSREGHTVNLIEVFRAICLRCNTPVPTEGKFYALDYPYNGVLHEQCAPLYNYPGKWPHPCPAKVYED